MFEILRKDIVLDIQRAEVERGPTTAALRVVWEVVFGITIMIMTIMIITIMIMIFMIKSPISTLSWLPFQQWNIHNVNNCHEYD